MPAPDHDSAATDTTGDATLPPSEATDSDELRNDDGDATVTPPDHWLAADSETAHESLDAKLAAEQPDVADSNHEPDEADEAAEGGRHRAQVSGSPEDGDSLFTVEE
ncbi:hypothetical protein AWC18_05200 [Mycolicibacter nonchromogenicus]|uniref:PAS domain S-box/diguanylate cyclase (GGDEF) domain-containing protein n=1 Tax=Mycolicibacter nonchromogenicus TaxID=1782 RepID=A0A1X1ZID3_MYCNO|nr:hypothetical protein [Mycolicibacter nonchromogenicus]ORW23137.1 hypothetical protein AWC18_05200 [Mycolicibacter nonchromogenicus]